MELRLWPRFVGVANVTFGRPIRVPRFPTRLSFLAVGGIFADSTRAGQGIPGSGICRSAQAMGL